ncbi:hypothetical protein [Spirosoma utsteinense]|uniref:Uncharacterized protein n=1 Tax=Spirosoma utsteinense TaxID=2585773 RepID=A0ABR6WB37_9BACT|nr:hypothetical protein [Spirosoma utsteinense]MBC3793733.1 hypothetical protein [Spirosoma utsteinense]
MKNVNANGLFYRRYAVVSLRDAWGFYAILQSLWYKIENPANLVD